MLALTGQWEKKEVTVIGTGGTDRLLFRESRASGASDGSGPYIDQVVLTKQQENPTASPTPSPTVPTCVTSESNLICNGSFELNSVPLGEKRDISDSTIPGWNALRNSVCLANFLGAVSAPDGSNFAELDCIAGGSVEGIYQDIPTVAGQPYTLSFMMRARDSSRAGTEDEGINVSV